MMFPCFCSQDLLLIFNINDEDETFISKNLIFFFLVNVNFKASKYISNPG